MINRNACFAYFNKNWGTPPMDAASQINARETPGSSAPASPRTRDERIALAQQRVESGLKMIQLQRRRLAEEIGRGQPTTASEGLLRAFYRAQAIYEDDRRAIKVHSR